MISARKLVNQVPRQNPEITLEMVWELISGLSRKELTVTVLFMVVFMWPIGAVSFMFGSAFNAATMGVPMIATWNDALLVSASFWVIAAGIAAVGLWLRDKGYLYPTLLAMSSIVTLWFSYAGITAVNVNPYAQFDMFFMAGMMLLASLTFAYQIIRYGRYGKPPES